MRLSVRDDNLNCSIRFSDYFKFKCGCIIKEFRSNFAKLAWWNTFYSVIASY